MSASLEIGGAPPPQLNLSRASWISYLVIFIPTGFALFAATMLHLPWIASLAIPLLLGLAWVVRSPQIGVYVLFAAALMVGVQPLTLAAMVTDVPFWTNLNQGSRHDLAGFGISPAEILMLAIVTGVLAKLALTRKLPPAGKLMWPYSLFGLSLVLGEVNGLVHGGNFQLSLWELRPQAYGFAAFVMATLLIRNRSQLKILLAILLVGEAVKGLEAVIRYYVILGQQFASTLGENQEHEDSYLLGLFLLATAIGLIWFRRPVTILLMVLSPLVLTAIVINHRRAGLLGLGVEIVIAMVVAYVIEPKLRGALLKTGAVMAVLGVAFVATFWNQQYGTIAEVIRPIKSLFEPSARDLSSDLYRIAETANLKLTFRSSPLIGIGFGHPYYVFYPQQGVARFDPLWNIIPHNTVLWIPMRMGIVGMITFWTLISMAIMEAIWTVRAFKDKFIRAVVVFALAGVFGVMFNGYVDVGLESYRNMVVLGILLAIISKAVHIAGEDRQRNQAGVVANESPRPDTSAATATPSPFPSPA